MSRKTRKLWKRLNNFYNLDNAKQAELLADLMVYLEEN